MVYKINTYDFLYLNKYEYDNSKWKDQLTKYNNQMIAYDQIGNPVNIGNLISLSWVNG